MKSKTIRSILKPLDVLVGINLHPGEDGKYAHAVCVKMGTATQAIDAINGAGGHAYHSHSFGAYSETINVRVKD